MTREKAIALLAAGDKALDTYERGSQAVSGYRAFRDGFAQIGAAAESGLKVPKSRGSGSEKIIMAIFTGVMGCYYLPAIFKKGE